MSEAEHELFAIDVDPDDYAETAAGDTPSTVSRTHQSEAAFQAIKAKYTAKQDNGDLYVKLLQALPLLDVQSAGSVPESVTESTTVSGETVAIPSERVKLGKKEWHLLGYAVGELYYEGKFEEIVELCAEVRRKYQVDRKMEPSLVKWSKRAQERIEGR